MKTIAIICGGDSAEHDVSMRSAAGIESFLDAALYKIYKVEIHAGEWSALLPDGTRSTVDRNDFSFADGKVTVYAGLTGNCISEQLAQVDAFTALGADVIVATLPSYYALTPELDTILIILFFLAFLF